MTTQGTWTLSVINYWSGWDTSAIIDSWSMHISSNGNEFVYETDGIETIYTGQLEVADLDTTDGHIFEQTGSASVSTDSAVVTEFAVVVSENGSYTIDGNFDSLADGEEATITFTYTAKDDSSTANALSAEKTVTLVVTGTNDAPTVVEESDFNAIEDGATITGQIVANDVDSDDDSTTLTYSLVGDAPTGLIFNSDGSYTFEASADEYQDLAEQVTRDVSFTWKATDSHGEDSVSSDTVIITVIGTNDAPVAVDDSTISKAGEVLVSETFEDGTATGWTNNSLDTSGSELTNFLELEPI